jgi:hypothetical protein
VARFGYLGTPEAEIVSVRDVPNDNGGLVKLSWNASYLDLNSDPNLSSYDILRSAPPSSAVQARARGTRIVPLGMGVPRPGELIATGNGAQTYYWEYLTSVSALHYLTGYSYIAPTTGDSIGAGNPLTSFMVVARNGSDTKFWPSQPASGYSVDNLPPGAPAPFTGAYLAGATQLHWGENGEPDLAGYRVYRGNSAGFVPSPANLIAAKPDTGYSDVGSAGSYYKLSAVDIHGNESAFSLLTPAAISGVGGSGLPRELALGAPQPNPARAKTMLSFALPEAEAVSLALYDMEGRRVRTVSSGRMDAGVHQLPFDLRDTAGREIPNGLYFVRLEAGGRTLTSRLAIVK